MAEFIDPMTLKRRLDEGTALLIDIREADEFARERIPGARHMPLSAWERHEIAAAPGTLVVLTCRSGNRTGTHAHRLMTSCPTGTSLLDGGIEAWKRAGLPVTRDPRAPLELPRQVQIVVGSMILIGFGLAWLVSDWFLALPLFAGAGLVFAGITGFCGMVRVLAAMPWNRPRPAG